MHVCLRSPSATRYNFEFLADIALVFIKKSLDLNSTFPKCMQTQTIPRSEQALL